MEIIKFGPPAIRGANSDWDIYFLLNKPEANAIGKPEMQALIVGMLTAKGGPIGAAAGLLISSYFSQIADKAGPNGCSIKMTVRSRISGLPQMKEFIAEPI